MPRVISFIVLLAIILLVGAVFFQVMAQFIVPLFLAAVLVVIFAPLYAWILRRVPGHPRICAGLTTVLILLAVLLPITWLGWRAYADFHALLTSAESTILEAERRADTTHVEPRSVTKDENASAGSRGALPVATEADEVGDVVANDASLIDDDLKETETTIQTVVHKRGLRLLVDDLTAKVRPLLQRLNEHSPMELAEQDFRPVFDRAAGIAGSLVLTIAQSAVGIVIGVAIMVISLYYFLADGPAMIRGLMKLSPLENAYERELLARFGQVSRAVVVAVLLSAVVQGALAGLGYAFALPHTAPIFLLTALTMIMAIVPFFGAAAVWIPVCIWIFFYGQRVGADGVVYDDGNWVVAVVLAIYSTIVVSGIDNLIKPLVLHGQSNLHPLLALLSILGGVQVLGPVGIIVGPMLVSFLQALLTMLRKEIDTFSDDRGSAHKLADRDFNVPQNVIEKPDEDESKAETVAVEEVAKVGTTAKAGRSPGVAHSQTLS